MGSPVGSPPNVNLAQNLAENDVVQEYLRMRQSNYESTLSEVVSNSPKHQQQYGMASPSSQPDPAAVEAEEEAKRKELAEAQRLQQEQDRARQMQLEAAEKQRLENEARQRELAQQQQRAQG